jgi:uncharacterized repeat protein (TIGR01451 family)
MAVGVGRAAEASDPAAAENGRRAASAAARAEDGGDRVGLGVPVGPRSGETINLALGVLPPLKSVTIRFRAQVNAAVPAGADVIATQATVTGSNFAVVLSDDPDTGAPADPTVTVLDAAPDLSLVKDDGTSGAAPLAVLSYALTAGNVGNQGATGVSVQETVPLGTSFVLGSSSGGWSCADGSPGGSACSLTLGPLAAGGSVPVVFAVRVASPPPDGVSQIANQAVIADDGANGPDPDPGNDTAVDVDYLPTDVSITVEDDRQAVRAGREARYRIRASNGSVIDAMGARVLDVLPLELRGASWSCSGIGGGVCGRARGRGGIVDRVDLPAGGAVEYRLEATVAPGTTGMVSHTASVEAPSGVVDTLPGDNTDTDTDVVVGAAVEGDFDGDGRSDILLFNATTGEVRQWRMSGLTVSSVVSVGTAASATARVVGVGDYDGNGVSDLLWRDGTPGRTYLWLNGSAVETVLPAAPFVGGVVVGSGDWDGDGTSDVLWFDPASTQAYVWLMVGGGVSAEGSLGFGGSGREVEGSGDYDFDGMSDVLWQDRTTGATSLWFVNGLSVVSLSAGPTMADLDELVVGVGDHNGDGRAQVLWQNQTTKAATVWVMDGASRVNVEVLAGASAGTRTPLEVKGSGDYDGDGRVDVVWLNGASTQVVVWLLRGVAIQSSGPVGVLPSPAAQWEIVRTR